MIARISADIIQNSTLNSCDQIPAATKMTSESPSDVKCLIILLATRILHHCMGTLHMLQRPSFSNHGQNHFLSKMKFAAGLVRFKIQRTKTGTFRGTNNFKLMKDCYCLCQGNLSWWPGLSIRRHFYWYHDEIEVGLSTLQFRYVVTIYHWWNSTRSYCRYSRQR